MREVQFLESLKKDIEQLNESDHLKILNILLENNVNISENVNGCFINLSDLDDDVIDKLCNFLRFLNEQIDNLNIVEDQKKSMKTKYFNK
tara:strand:- start:170 stop:439 length:270 start_codon:yes stop_codon:yes gene_type:complete